MKQFLIYITTLLTIISSFFFPFASIQAQNEVFDSYANIFKQGISGGAQGLEECTRQSVQGFVSSMTPVLARTTIDAIKNLINGSVPVNTEMLNVLQERSLEAAREMNIKETCLDSIAAGVAQQMLSDLINNSISWINRIVDGQPGYIQNLNFELQRLAVRSFRDYVRTSGVVSATCSGFRDQILTSIDAELSAAYGEGGLFVDTLEPLEPFEQEECGLYRITGGREQAERFLRGEDFASSGGWEAFREVLRQQEYQYIIEAQIVQQIAQERELLLLDYQVGGGYRSEVQGDEPNECQAGFSFSEQDGACINNETGARQPRIVVTSGRDRQNIVQQILNSDINRVLMADELSEVYAIAGDFLITKLFDGARDGFGLIKNRDGRSVDSINTLGNGSLFDNRESRGAQQGGGIFNGSDPAGALLTTVESALRTERNLLVELNKLNTEFNSTTTNNVIERINQCSLFGSNLTLKASADSFLGFPTLIASGNYTRTVTEKQEIGPQKVDWAGNDFDWVEGQMYGNHECKAGTYPTQNTRSSYQEKPQYGYYVTRVTTNGKTEFKWVIHVCVVQKDGRLGGSNFELKQIDYSPSAFREPIAPNKQKIDWNGLELNWRRIDPYQQENRYVFRECNQATAGRVSYQVGSFTRIAPTFSFKAHSSDRPGSIIGYIPNSDSQNYWYSATCSPTRYNDDDTRSTAINEHWTNITRVGPAFQTLSSNTVNSVQQRITTTESLIRELETLLESRTCTLPGIRFISEESALPQHSKSCNFDSISELQMRQRELNALRSSYAFSESREITTLRTMYNEYVSLRTSLLNTAQRQCNESS